MTGPLAGVRVLELDGLGPTPHGAMMLADLGADVVRVERPDGIDLVQGPGPDWLMRNRRSIALDLKHPGDLAVALDLADRADVLIEGNRPGVTERLGIGPDVCLERNPRLVYARMTGWGQSGPRAQQVGHDINYLALTGALHAIGADSAPPPPPLNLVADVAGGASMLAVGVLGALVERQRTGRGQVVDVAMVDGVSTALQVVWALRARRLWSDTREANVLDGGHPCYRTYRCAGGGFVAVGALEPHFYAALLTGLGLTADEIPDRDDPRRWPVLTAVLAGRFLARTRDEWAAIFADGTACVTPVLTFAEAASDPHLAARGSVVTHEGVTQAGTSPRFSAHPDASAPTPPPVRDADRDAILHDWLAVAG